MNGNKTSDIVPLRQEFHVEELKLSGPKLFLRYAWPCAEDRLNANLIKQEDFNELKYFIENSVEPGIILLTLCFPTAVRALRDFSCDENKMWLYSQVEKFWRYNHEKTGDCAVIKAMVCEICNGRAMVIYNGKSFVCLNTYKLKLEIGDNVYIHRRVIIEKEEE